MSCDNGNILPIPLHNCLAKWYQVLFVRNIGREIEASGLLPPFTTIEQFMLKNQHGIIVTHRAFEDAFSMIGIGDADYFQAWHMHEKLSGHCPCCAPRFVVPTGARVTIGTLSFPP